MENYKEINRELIDANREMRLHIATYQKEVLQLRAELVEQRRLRVEFERDYRARLVSALTRNFREALEEVDPTSSLLDVLGGQNPDNVTKPYSSTDCRNDTTGRRSSLILSEFRRSSALLRRRSALPTSPTWRHSVETVDNSQENDENIEPQTHLQIINEGNEGDLSGNSKSGNSSCQHTNLHKPQSNDLCPGTKEELGGATRIDRVVVIRGKQRKNTLERKEESIEEPRLVSHIANDPALTPAKFLSCTDEHKTEDDTSYSSSMALSELMENFIDAPRSTPCSMAEVCSDNYKKHCFRSHADDISNARLTLTESQDQTASGRPLRRCAPKVLTEPSLMQKLRNESAAKKKKKVKKN